MSIDKEIYYALIDSSLARLGVAAMSRLLPEPHIAPSYYEIPVPGLPASLAGLRLLHVSDLHLRPGSELAEELPQLAMAVPHDVIVYTGDFIDNDDGIAPVAALLARMPRAPYAYAVLGNHDYKPLGRSRGSNDVRRLRAALADAGITVLTNCAQPICGGELFVAGVDDPATRHDDIGRAMSSVPTGACSVLLAHTPDIILRLDTYRPGLILAGHTHGGQIRLPIIGALRSETKLPRRWSMGLREHQGIPVFVTRGIGYSGINLRLGCPPEVAVITLQSPQAAERAA